MPRYGFSSPDWTSPMPVGETFTMPPTPLAQPSSSSSSSWSKSSVKLSCLSPNGRMIFSLDLHQRDIESHTLPLAGTTALEMMQEPNDERRLLVVRRRGSAACNPPRHHHHRLVAAAVVVVVVDPATKISCLHQGTSSSFFSVRQSQWKRTKMSLDRIIASSVATNHPKIGTHILPLPQFPA